MKDRLIELRQEKGLSQEQLGKIIGIHPSNIGKWERGECFPGVQSIKILTKFYGCTAGYLIGIEN